MKVEEDCVFVRCADLDTPDKIYAADIYCHNSCYKRCVTLSSDPNMKVGLSASIHILYV
jgi:hypothetical protein